MCPTSLTPHWGREGDLFDGMLNSSPTKSEVTLNALMVSGSKDKFSIQLVVRCEQGELVPLRMPPGVGQLQCAALTV